MTGSGVNGGATWMRRFAPDLTRVAYDHALPVISALALTGLLIRQSFGLKLAPDTEEWLIVLSASAFFASFGIDLACALLGRSRVLAVGLGIGTVALLAILLHAGPIWRPVEPMLVAGLAIGALTLPFIVARVPLDAYWAFNERAVTNAAVALASAGLVALGLLAIDTSLDVLFGISFSNRFMEAAVPASFTLLAPLFWLSSLPGSAVAPETLRPDFLGRTAGLVARFLLAPLLGIYAAILFAYAGMILVEGEFPRGQVGWMVSAFGTVGALTILALYPERRTGGRAVQIFWRWWFAVTLVPVVLLVLAIRQRLAAYGWTEERGLLALVALWLGVLAVLFTWRRGERNIRIIPGLLAMLLILGSFGPWGTRGLSLIDQGRRLQALMSKAGAVQGASLPEQDAVTAALTPEERWRLRSIVLWFGEQQALDLLIARHPELAQAAAARRREIVPQIWARLGVEDAPPVNPERPIAIGFETATGQIDLGTGAEIIGPFRLRGPGAQTIRIGNITVAIADDAVTIRELEAEARFDLGLLVPEMEGFEVSLPDSTLTAQLGSRDVRLVALELFSTREEDATRIENVEFLLVLSPRP